MLNSNLKVLGADSFKKQETGVGKRCLFIYMLLIICIFFFAKKCTSRKSRFRLNFCLILHQWGADVMKLDILAAFNTNSRRLIRIWRSWGLVPSRNRKQGAARVGPGVGKIFKNMKIGKSWKMGWEWSGEVQTGPKWSGQLSEGF